MNDKMFFPRETLGTVYTSMWHVSGVLSDVLGEMFLSREGARTIRALVRSLPRMLSAQQSTFRFDYLC